MNLRTILAVATLSIASMTAHAGVMYEWVPLNNETPRDISFKIVFDYGAVESASYKIDYWQGNWYDARPIPGLVSINYLFPGNPRGVQYSIDRGFASFGAIYLDVAFTSDWLMTGNIRVGNDESHIYMSSQGKVFTVTDANSDDFAIGAAGCVPSIKCKGATGEFRRVPEPSTVALLGLGLASAWVARRRKQRGARAA